MRRKVLSLVLALCMVLTLVPTTAFAEDGVDFSGDFSSSAANYTLEGETFAYLKSSGGSGTRTLYDLLPTTGTGAREYIDISNIANKNHPVVVKKPENVQNFTHSEVYECIGVVKYDSSKHNSSFNANTNLNAGDIENFGQNTELTFELTDSNIRSVSKYKYVTFAFIWQKADTYTVTYDFTGPEGATAVYPVVSKYHVHNLNESPYSVGYFTVPKSEDALNLIYQDGDEAQQYQYSGGKPGNNDKYIEEYRVDLTSKKTLSVKVAKGQSVSLPHLAQHRNRNFTIIYEQFYPVISFVAVGSGGTYYELTGWKVDDAGDTVANGLYGSEYTPSNDITLKAVWTEVTLSDSPDVSAIPEVPMLASYEVDQQNFSVKLEQKTTVENSYLTSPTSVGKDGVLDYRLSMKFDGIFSQSEMPWENGNGNYFKAVDNTEFADVKVNVTLGDHVVPVTEADGKTPITISGSFLKVKSVEAGGETYSEVTHGNLGNDTVKADLGENRSFTINFEWKKDASSLTELHIDIPTKAEDGYFGEIAGPIVTVTGGIHLDKAHTAAQNDSKKADFNADAFIRYLLASDEAWFKQYGGENMTLTNMLQAAKDVQKKLNEFTLTANTVTVTAPVRITEMTVEPAEVTLNVGESTIPTVTITPDEADKTVKWAVEGSDGVVTVDADTGEITAVKPGTATVTGTSTYDSEFSGKVNVTVNGLIYVEPTAGGAVTISGDDVTAIDGVDNAYSVKKGASVTVTVTPEEGNKMASAMPSVYYYEANGNKKPLEAGSITTNEDGTFTFTLPDASMVYVSAPFVIEGGAEGDTVIDEPTVNVEDRGASYQYSDKKRLDVELSQDAIEEMMAKVKADNDAAYSETALETALDSANVEHNDGVYRHVQTRADIKIEEYNSVAYKGLIKLDIEFQYRVVAATVTDPAAIKTDGTVGDQNAVVIHPTSGGDDDGWVKFESTAPTYIVVPVSNMGKAGDWVKATHTHEYSDGTKVDYTQYLQVQSDKTVVYNNSHEGYSSFTFEQLTGVKDIQVQNDSDGNTILYGFEPNPEKTFSIQVANDVESVTVTPKFTVSEGNTTTGLNGTATLTVNDVPVEAVVVNKFPAFIVQLKDNSDNLIVFNYAKNQIDQTYTINITRGTLPTPPEEQPAEPTTTPTYPSFRPAPSTRFYDVDQTEWYTTGIDYVVKNGLMNGVSETDFAPEAPTTRAMLVTILYRLDGEPAVTKNIPFSDVASGTWYSDAINWAAANEIVGGYGDDTFRPMRDLTREEAATILYRYAAYKKYDVTTTSSLTGYTDAASVQSYATAPMSWAVGTELINGTSATTLAPNGGAIRAQIATILMRFCENVVK